MDKKRTTELSTRMNSSSNPLQDGVSFFFLILIYVPFNVFFMVVAAVLFSLINKLFHLHFPTWIVAVAAALLVFVFMFSFLEESLNRSNSGDSTLFYAITLVINLVVVIIMLTATGINKLIFSDAASTDFVFEKPQIITAIIYSITVAFFAAIPLISDGADYVNDIQNDRKLAAIREAITTDDSKAFTKINDETTELWKVVLPDEKNSLLDYLVAGDKIALVHILVKDHKELFGYTFEWHIKSPAMVQLLINDGMGINQIVEKLTKHDEAELVKTIVEKYHPTFNSSVSFITQNIMHHNNEKLLDYLIKNGLTKDLKQTSETLYWLVQKNDIESVGFLIDKGFSIDPSDNRLVYWAIYNRNLPFLKFLFSYPFDVNASSDEYTNLENAIIGNNEAIFDFLLTKNPDIKTLHPTKLNGITNALLIAERYKQTKMLEKLNRYATRN
ncbi:ankyrin repeat domain-containing protein [Spirosoma endbachense]|uniref:Ankyrin repeat domain-containing protein n=1 Tax=Spirosoma endbachense TaxID=2666025 RepID=A0A6P1VQ51_9BACT|nr:ankyrin repeat domain-containing protein [Spirosoma endbachense]QHV95391.1 hypothetical protein GJR95_10385 [Spirosoma endbachense]